jgi:intraflagellar transport protein 80
MASVKYGHLIIATASQCYIYDERNFNTPSIIDLASHSRVITILQSQRFACDLPLAFSNTIHGISYFLIVDTVSGIQIFSYDAKLVSNPKYPGLRLEFLNRHTLSLSNDVLAVRDRNNEKGCKDRTQQ